jgi:hypothetical protein
MGGPRPRGTIHRAGDRGNASEGGDVSAKKRVPERFGDEQSGPKRGLQIYLLLIAAAAERRTITYKGLADAMGIKGTGVLGPLLDYPWLWCEQQGLPPLTTIVVGGRSGEPGHEFEKVDRARERVYSYDWFGLVPPTWQELQEAKQTK